MQNVACGKSAVPDSQKQYGGFLGLNLLLLPGLFTLAVWVGNRHDQGRPLRTAIASQAQALLPLGLGGWVAFTLSFALPKAHYVLAVLSDPLGWGWDLFGTTGASGFPGLVGPGQLLQAAILLAGLFWSAEVAHKRTRSRWEAFPVQVFGLTFTIVMLWLLI